MSFEQTGIEAVVKNLNGFLSDVGKMDHAIDALGSSTSGLTDWNNKITSVTSTVAKTVGIAVAGMAAGFAGFVADSVKKSADFEQGLANIGAVLGKTMDEIVPLKDLILDLGLDPKLKVSATEAAQAIEMLARNGLEMGQILDGAARSTILLANATGGDFSLAADTVTDAMGVFKISAEDMSAAVDQVTGVTSNSKFTLQDYAYAISAGGSAAANAGVEFEDYNAVLAGTAQAFSGGSDAGTSFKTFVTRLVPETKSASTAMKELGLYTGLTQEEFKTAQDKIGKYQKQLIELDPTSKNFAKDQADLNDKIQVLKDSLVQGQNAFFDTSGSMKGMDQVAGLLQGAFGDLTEEQRIHYSQMIFGQDAYRTALGLADLGTEKFNNLKGAIADVNAEKNAEIRMGTLSGAMEILAGVVETLQIKIGNKFNPVVAEMTKSISEFIDKHSDEIVDFFGIVADKVAGAVTELIPLAEEWLPKLVTWVGNSSVSIAGLIPKIVDVVTGIGSFIGKVSDTLEPLIAWVSKNVDLDDLLAAIGTTLIVSLIPAITSFVSTITPLVALIGGIIALVNNLDESQRGLAVAIGVAVFAIPPIVAAITSIGTVISTVITIGGSLVSLITGAAGIVPALGLILNPVGLVVAAVAGLGVAWATDFGGIQTKTTEVVGKVSKSIGEWASDTSEKFKETQGNIGKTLASWSENIGTTLSGWSKGIGQTFSGLAENVIGSNKKLAEDSQGHLWQLYQSGKIGAEEFSNRMRAISDGQRSEVSRSFKGLSDDSVKELSRLFSEGSTSATDLRSALGRLSSESSNTATNNYRALTNESLRELSRLFSEGSANSQRLSDALRSQSINASGSVKSTLSNMVSESLTALRRYESEGASSFTKFRDNATNKVVELARDIPNRLRELVDAGLRIFDVGKWVQAGADVIGGIMTGLARAATAPLRWIENFAGSLIRTFTSILKIASPSQVFDEAGVDIMEGLEGGLETRSAGVLTFMGEFSRSLVATAEEAQRLADANFKALTDSALAAYDGAAVILGDLSRLSTEIDQEAIAAQNAAHAAYVAQQAAQNSATSQAAGQNPLTQGRTSELINQILDLVKTDFAQSGQNGITSGGIDLAQFSSTGAIQNAIASLKLLSGTIQQNAGVAQTSIERERLTSLYNDVTGRILPLLQSEVSRRESEAAAVEAAAKAAEEAAKVAAQQQAQADAQAAQAQAMGAARSTLAGRVNGLVDIIDYYLQNGLKTIVTNFNQLTGIDEQAFKQADTGVQSTFARLVSYTTQLEDELKNLYFGTGQGGSQGALTRIGEVLGRIGQSFELATHVTDTLQGTSISSADAQLQETLQTYLSTTVSSLLQALPVYFSGSGTNIQNVVNVGDINSGMDFATLQAYLEQSFAAAIGG